MKYAEVIMPLRKLREQLTEEDYKKLKGMVTWTEERMVPETFVDEVRLAIQEADTRELFSLGEHTDLPFQPAMEW